MSIIKGIAIGFLLFDKRGRKLVFQATEIVDKNIKKAIENGKDILKKEMPETCKMLKVEQEGEEKNEKNNSESF